MTYWNATSGASEGYFDSIMEPGYFDWRSLRIGDNTAEV